MISHSMRNPLGKFFPILLLSVILLCSKSSIDCTNATYNTMEISNVEQHIDQSPQYMIKKGTQTNFLRKSLTNPSSVLFKSLAALIGIVAISFTIVRCARYINNGKTSQLKSRRLMDNGGKGCDNQGDSDSDSEDGSEDGVEDGVDQTQGPESDDEEGAVGPAGGEENDDWRALVFPQVFVSVENKPIEECRDYIKGELLFLFNCENEKVVSQEEIDKMVEERSRAWKNTEKEPVKAIKDRPISEGVPEDKVRDLEIFKSNLYTDYYKLTLYDADPAVMSLAIEQVDRIFNKIASKVDKYLLTILHSLLELDGKLKGHFYTPDYWSDIRKMQKKPEESKTEEEKIMIRIFGQIIPHLYEFNNRAADIYSQADAHVRRLKRPDEELLQFAKWSEEPRVAAPYHDE